MKATRRRILPASVHCRWARTYSPPAANAKTIASTMKKIPTHSVIILARTVLKTPELVFGSRDEALLPVYHFDRLPTVSGGFHKSLEKTAGPNSAQHAFPGSQASVSGFKVVPSPIPGRF